MFVAGRATVCFLGFAGSRPLEVSFALSFNLISPMKPTLRTFELLRNAGAKSLVGAVATAAILSGASHASEAEKPKKPNILLLVADDTAFGDIGAFGSEVQTPNLNRIADAGVRFTNFHVSPVCSVTRSMLLTGNNSIEVGLGAFDYSFIRQGVVYMDGVLIDSVDSAGCHHPAATHAGSAASRAPAW